MDNAIQRIIVSIGLLLTIAVGCFYWRATQNVRKYTVAVFYSPVIPFHARFSNALKKTVSQDKRFSLVEYTPSSLDQIVLNAVCEAILNDASVDLIVVIGQCCSQSLIKLSQRRNRLKPIVFAGVADPVVLGIVDSVERPGKNATGLFLQTSLQTLDLINLALLIKPKVKTILFPYAMNELHNEQRLQMLEKGAVRKKMTFVPLPVEIQSQVLDRMRGKLSGIDMIMHFEEDMVAECGAGMGKLASQNGITMFATSPDGMENAAVSYSPDSTGLVVPVFELVRRILINHESPAVIPAQLMDGNRSLIINTALCAQQDLKDIDIERIVHTINTDPQFAVVRDNIIIQ